ncbi:cytochrome c [Stieleria sp. TO1_6]|uniref:cytochrome c n=1 Tax=Stieleria tagensis TaxID=2956795 RepID=UPI00209B459D|nr:cytochrome c [Stieleria tagensis]MCO8124297.1 cytochrome c [Stieleria tagensis]
MPTRNQTFATVLFLGITAVFSLLFFPAYGEDKRAAAPKFSPNDTQGIFFNSVGEAIRGQRPSIESLRAKTMSTPVGGQGAADSGGPSEPDASGKGPWDKLISATSLEDEIKRKKLHYDTVVTQPGPFKSGGYEEARLDLMVMSSLFAIISEYGGDVRWKEDAASARDLLARTAFNCSSGSTQVFNEARARKDDLQDLISGTGLRSGKAEDSTDWTSVADRSPMMEYADQLRESLRKATGSPDDVTAEPGDVRRPAELLAVLGRILVQKGMDEADDPDYIALSNAMTEAALGVRRGLELNDYDAIGKSVGDLTQSCDACHEQYR